MEDQLLVRIYNVGLGDFIYLRVPDRRRQVHIVIDCGNKFDSAELLKARLDELKKELPRVRGKRRIDLLVVSHPHEDHHKGFDPAWFADVRIDRIWLSPAFNRLDPQAQAFHALQDAAARALQTLVRESAPFAALAGSSTPELPNSSTPELYFEATELLALSRDEAVEALCHTLPAMNGIEPLYVTADTPPEKLKLFRDPRITLKALNPMANIDAYYLGGAGLNALVQPTPAAAAAPVGSPGSPETFAAQAAFAPADAAAYAALFPAAAGFTRPGLDGVGAQPLADLAAADAGGVGAEALAGVSPPQWAWTPAPNAPANISSQDFKRLQERVRSNALAAVEVAGHAVNNLSVTLLLEWRGRRLLFPGDAECNDGREIAVKPGRCNGAWNVMWSERRADLSRPLDFLKIGHHGSENATPWRSGHPIAVILDALLPLPAPGQAPTARAVASTRRTTRWQTIPDPALMVELGRRVANTRREYVEPPGSVRTPDGVAQPQRTDLERQATGNEITCIELWFSE